MEPSVRLLASFAVDEYGEDSKYVMSLRLKLKEQLRYVKTGQNSWLFAFKPFQIHFL